MDEHALRVLEFDKVLGRLAALTSFSAGRDLALSIRPSSDFEEVVRRQRLLADAMRLRVLRAALNLTSALDSRMALDKAGLGGVLDARELLAVGTTQRVAQHVKSALTRTAANLPLLAEMGERLSEQPRVVAEISRSIDPRGEVTDDASPALRLVRRDIRIAHDRLHSKLQEFLSSSAGRTVTQEPIVTLRDGRYVIPVKSEFRGEVRGIVHDVSSSGATVFIEPLAVVDLANKWRELQIEEAREVEKVLRELSALVGAAAGALTENLDLLAELDVLMAGARLAEELSPAGLSTLPDADRASDPREWLCRAPAPFVIVDGRHPLLTSPVPITIRIGDGDNVLLITGPNTGGKTVALKTIGLMSLMAQAGLPVPVSPGSSLPVFDQVLADIGDEQSIEQSLSTFSGHLKNIIQLLESVTGQSLVLLDELAAGTDPSEGAALARAVLQHLLDRGALVVATTHHGELKLFAHSTEGVRNAAVDFDAETFAPTYHITLGVPGRSNALAIAARLGLPESILVAAQSSLAPEEAEIDSLLQELRRERDAAATARRAEEQARKRAEEARTRAEQRLAVIEEEKAQRLDEAAVALEQELDAARDALAQARRLSERQRVAPIATQELAEAQAAVETAATTAKRMRRRSRRKRPGGLRPEQVKPGFQVWLQGVPTPAEALTAPDARGELDVSLGALRARVRIEQVVRVERQAGKAVAPRTLLPPPPAAAAEEIEVRGQTLDEALPLVEGFLDQGFRAGVPRLRVVHGKGTGRMRTAVWQMLARHPLVKRYEFAPPREGGEGVTIVEMAVS